MEKVTEKGHNSNDINSLIIINRILRVAGFSTPLLENSMRLINRISSGSKVNDDFYDGFLEALNDVISDIQFIKQKINKQNITSKK